jgi:hypothetical protein
MTCTSIKARRARLDRIRLDRANAMREQHNLAEYIHDMPCNIRPYFHHG